MRPRALVLVACLALGVWGTFFAAHGHFAGDSGVKYAQSVALWQTGFQSRALPAERAIDPDEKLLPYGHFYRHVNGERQGIYSLFFTALAAPPIGLLGAAGGWVVAFLGVVLVAIGLVRLGERLDVPPAIAPLLCLLGTPLFFYATQLQEHTLAAGLVALALAAVVRSEAGAPVHPLAAGLAAGLAGTLRPEGYLAAAAVGLAALAGPGPRLGVAVRYALGAALPVAAYWALNTHLSGTIDPLLARNTRWEGDLGISMVMLMGWIHGAPWRLFGPIILAVGAGLVPAGRHRPLLTAAAGAALLYLAALSWERNTFRMPVGLLAVTPLAGLGLAAPVWSPRWRQLWLFAVTFLAAALILNKSEDAGGLQLGARLLMPVLPVLVFLAVGLTVDDLRTIRGWPRVAVAWAPALLAATGLAINVSGTVTGDRLARDAAQAAEHAASCPGRIVAVRVWWAAQVLTPVLSGGKALLTNHHEPALLFDRLAAAGEREIAYVSADDPPAGWRTTEVHSGWLPVRCVERLATSH